MSTPSTTERRRALPISKTAQQLRREEFLKRQQNARVNLVENMRKLLAEQRAAAVDVDTEADDTNTAPIMDSCDSMIDSATESAAPATDAKRNRASQQARRASRARQQRMFFARQLMMPEWLIDLPEDFAEDWMVMPRPEGVRCLVIATGGETVSRKRNGVILHRFASSLPAGSRMTNQGKQGACILDCIYQNQIKTYFIIDLMCWKGYDLYDSTTEFRRFWIDSKLAEIASIGSVTPSVNEFRFLALPSAPLTAQSLADVYQPFAATSNRFGFGQDGILFYNNYEMGVSPLVLIWKDAHCSRFPIDVDDTLSFGNKQVFCLAVDAEAQFLETHDQCKLLQLTPEFMAHTGAAPGWLLRLSTDGFEAVDQHPRLLNVECHELYFQTRLLPDTWSRIVFQFLARHQRTISIAQLGSALTLSEVSTPPEIAFLLNTPLPAPVGLQYFSHKTESNSGTPVAAADSTALLDATAAMNGLRPSLVDRQMGQD